MLAVNASVPVFIFDPLNVVRIKGFDKVIVEKTTVESGEKLGELFNKIKLNSKGVVIGFVDMLQEEQSEFADKFFSTWKPHDCIIMFDELHEFVPERGVGGGYSFEVERVLRHGRNSNIGFVLTSQRASFVSKKVLALSDFVLLYRMTWEHDIEAAKRLIGNVMPRESVTGVLASLQTLDFLDGYAVDFQPTTTIT